MAMQKVVQDSSGIVGLFNVEQAAQNIYLAMHAIQHRGQDGVGVAVSNGESVVCKKGLGLLSENLKQDTLNSLDGDIAIGQLRMATKNDSQLEKSLEEGNIATVIEEAVVEDAYREKELVEAILKAEKEENTISGKKINTKNRKEK